jgi:hypothetical protein
MCPVLRAAGPQEPLLIGHDGAMAQLGTVARE